MSSEAQKFASDQSLTTYTRLSRHELFMEVSRLYGRRSTCPRASVGAVAVRDGRIVAAGYNGAPAGRDHCLTRGCILDNGVCVRAVHAEANLIAWAARTGTPLHHTTLYCTHAPCRTCAKLILNAGVSRVIYDEDYHDAGLDLLHGIVEKYPPVEVVYAP